MRSTTHISLVRPADAAGRLAILRNAVMRCTRWDQADWMILRHLGFGTDVMTASLPLTYHIISYPQFVVEIVEKGSLKMASIPIFEQCTRFDSECSQFGGWAWHYLNVLK
jgi:hypothetical protein